MKALNFHAIVVAILLWILWEIIMIRHEIRKYTKHLDQP
jgi:hypothetical protein